MKSLFFLFLVSFFSYSGFSQQVFNQINTGTVELPDQSVKGIQTQVAFSADEVEKSFWRFCQGFSKTTNLRTHYVVSIPTEVERIYILAQIESQDVNRTVLRLALKEEAQGTRYQPQLSGLLTQFILQVQLDHFQMEIDLLEARAASIAEKNMREIKISGKSDKGHLFALRKIQSEIAAIREKQRAVLEKG